MNEFKKGDGIVCINSNNSKTKGKVLTVLKNAYVIKWEGGSAVTHSAGYIEHYYDLSIQHKRKKTLEKIL